MKFSFLNFFCDGGSRPATPHPELDQAIERAKAEEAPVVSYAKALRRPELLVPDLDLGQGTEAIASQMRGVEAKHQRVLAALANLGVFSPAQAGAAEIEMSTVDDEGSLPTKGVSFQPAEGGA